MYLYTYEKYSLPKLAQWLHLMIRAKREKPTNKMAREQRGKYMYVYIFTMEQQRKVNKRRKKKLLINKRQTITKF